VAVYKNKNEVRRAYEEIAILSSEGDASGKRLINFYKKKARELGADAIIFKNANLPYYVGYEGRNGSIVHEYHGEQSEATVIVYIY